MNQNKSIQEKYMTTDELNASTMEATNSDKFYILKPGDKVLVDQIRRKVYMDGKVKYLIESVDEFKFVTKEEFYTLAPGIKFLVNL